MLIQQDILPSALGSAAPPQSFDLLVGLFPYIPTLVMSHGNLMCATGIHQYFNYILTVLYYFLIRILFKDLTCLQATYYNITYYTIVSIKVRLNLGLGGHLGSAIHIVPLDISQLSYISQIYKVFAITFGISIVKQFKIWVIFNQPTSKN